MDWTLTPLSSPLPSSPHPPLLSSPHALPSPLPLQPGHTSGDVFAILKVMDHVTFRRKGHDLYMTKKIGVVESLCGCSFDVDFLDGKVLQLKVEPGEVIRPGQWAPVNALCMYTHATHANSCMKTALLSAPVGWPVLSSHLPALCGRCLECTLRVPFMYGSGDTDDTLLKGFVKFKVVCRDLQVYVRTSC